MASRPSEGRAVATGAGVGLALVLALALAHLSHVHHPTHQPRISNDAWSATFPKPLCGAHVTAILLPHLVLWDRIENACCSYSRALLIRKRFRV